VGSANVSVTVNGLTSNNSPFSVVTVPTITGLNPTVGYSGQNVTISGFNFGATQSTSSVTFNGTLASVTGWSATGVLVTVPPGATSGPVIVTVGGTPSSGAPFWTVPAPPPCPSRTVSLAGSIANGQVDTYALDLLPCQTVSFTFNITSDGGIYSTNFYLTLKDQAGVAIGGPSEVRNCCGTGVPWPQPGDNGGSPVPATAGPHNIPYTVEFTSSAVFNSIHSIYTGTATIAGRNGYNTGSNTFDYAPLLTTLPSVIRGTLANNDNPQYFRVHLTGNGTLRLNGTAYRQNTGWASILQANIYTSPTSAATNIVNVAVGGSGGPTTTFTSNLYTNPSSTDAEVYLRLTGPGVGGSVIEAFEITVSGDSVPVCSMGTSAFSGVATSLAGASCVEPAPKLQLFLDADTPGNFDPLNPQSDVDTYVPGAEQSNDPNATPPKVKGVSLAVPSTATCAARGSTYPCSIQRVQLIAAYVDAAGHIVPPPTFDPASFTLNDGSGISTSSALKGIAMNAPDPRGDDSPDFVLISSSAPFSTTDYTARVDLDVWDYGGFATVTVNHSMATAQVHVPKDENLNWLPDAGWYVGATVVPDSGGLSSDDTDLTPVGDDLAGDGLTSFEEYRGFVVNGTHTRTDPSMKDVFVFSQFETLGLGFTWTLPLTVHQIRDTELDGFRRIAFNYQNIGYGGDIPGHFIGTRADGTTSEQLGVIVFQDTTTILSGGASNPAVGSTDVLVPGAPWTVGPRASSVYTVVIRQISPTHNDQTTIDVFDSDKMSQTIAHEVGHNVGLYDVYLNCPPAATTIMVASNPPQFVYFSQTTDASDCAWNNIPTSYTATDYNTLRVR
jgi:hypothetical protein